MLKLGMGRHVESASMHNTASEEGDQRRETLSAHRGVAHDRRIGLGLGLSLVSANVCACLLSRLDKLHVEMFFEASLVGLSQLVLLYLHVKTHLNFCTLIIVYYISMGSICTSESVTA